MAARKTVDKKAAWKNRREHDVVLPSGFTVRMQVPNLPLLVKTGFLPNNLVQEALKAVQAGTLSAELVAEQAEFYAKLVTIAVVDPQLEPEDVTGDDPIPFEDIELIVEIATRQRDVDAIGQQLGGLHTTSAWREFRGVGHLYADVADAPGGETSVA